MAEGEMEQQTHLVFMIFYPHFLLGFKILMKISIPLILSMGLAQLIQSQVKLSTYMQDHCLYLGTM